MASSRTTPAKSASTRKPPAGSKRTTPAKREAVAASTLAIRFEGKSYNFPATPEDWPGDALDALEDQHLSRFLRGVLSAEDWARFKETSPTAGKYGQLADQYLTAVGLGNAGE